MMIKLKESGVIFDKELHSYTLNGLPLRGITGLIHDQLFNWKYKEVPKSVLERAAAYGNKVHEQIELYDSGFKFLFEGDEVKNYVKIKKKNGLKTIRNEYLVTDRANYASPIDLVFQNKDGDILLADIKTTSYLDEDYLRWQLSIYAYLFELQNPGINVKSLHGIWLRNDKYDFVELKRIDNEQVKKLLECGVTGAVFELTENENKDKENAPAEIIDAESKIYDLITKINSLSKTKEELSNGLFSLMKKHNIKSYKGEKITLSLSKECTRKILDKENLKRCYPDIYEEFSKVEAVKERLTIKAKKV